MHLAAAGTAMTSIGPKLRKIVEDLVKVKESPPKAEKISNGADDLTNELAQQPAIAKYSNKKMRRSDKHKKKIRVSKKQPPLNRTTNLIPDHSTNPRPLRSYKASVTNPRLTSGLDYNNYLNLYNKGKSVVPSNATLPEYAALNNPKKRIKKKKLKMPDQIKDNRVTSKKH